MGKWLRRLDPIFVSLSEVYLAVWVVLSVWLLFQLQMTAIRNPNMGDAAGGMLFFLFFILAQSVAVIMVLVGTHAIARTISAVQTNQLTKSLRRPIIELLISAAINVGFFNVSILEYTSYNSAFLVFSIVAFAVFIHFIVNVGQFLWDRSGGFMSPIIEPENWDEDGIKNTTRFFSKIAGAVGMVICVIFVFLGVSQVMSLIGLIWAAPTLIAGGWVGIASYHLIMWASEDE